MDNEHQDIMFNAISPTVRVISSEPKQARQRLLEMRAQSNTEIMAQLIRSDPQTSEDIEEGTANLPVEFKTAPPRIIS